MHLTLFNKSYTDSGEFKCPEQSFAVVYIYLRNNVAKIHSCKTNLLIPNWSLNLIKKKKHLEESL